MYFIRGFFFIQKRNCNSDVDNAELIDLVAKLHEQLNSSKGKKVYGYLKADVKKTVDEIFIRLSENESIQKMYSLWCEMEQQKHDVYSSAKLQFPKLADNKEFKSVKNMIIRTVLDMNSPVVDIEIEEPELTAEEFTCSNESAVTVDIDDEPQSKYYLKWSTAYKEACKIIYNKQSKLEDFQKAEQLLLNESRSGNVLAIHDLGKLYSTEKLGEKNDEKSFSFYREALHALTVIEPNADSMLPYEPRYEGQNMKSADMRSYVWYRIGKMHCYGLGTEQDYKEAFKWFEKSAQEGNKFAQYSLANLYYYGNGIEKNSEKAFEWYKKSAAHGQPYASYAVAQMYNKGEYVPKNEDTAQRYYKDALSGFLELESKGQADDNLYYKLGSMFKNGLGTEADISKAIDYFKRSAEMNNKNGLYEYGKVLIQGKHIEADLNKGLECIEKSIKLGNSNAKRFLALEYISGECFPQDIEKGIAMLTECADEGDNFASFKLGQIYLKGEIVPQDLEKAEKYLLSAEDNEYTQYALGKLYLQKEKYDIQKAVDHFKHSADMNKWSSYQLGVLYLFGAEGLAKDKEQAAQWLTKSANDGNGYAQNMLNNIDDFENMQLRNTVMGLFVNLSRCIEDDYYKRYSSAKQTVDKKLKQMIRLKKQDMGIKEENTMAMQ